MAVEQTAKFMDLLAKIGVEPSQVVFEGYKFALASMTDAETSINMEAAAKIARDAALNVGVHAAQLRYERKG